MRYQKNSFMPEQTKDDSAAGTGDIAAAGLGGLLSKRTAPDDGSFQLYTVALNDDELISRLLEHNVDCGSPYTPPVSPLLEMLITYILPFAIMMLLLSLVFRIMTPEFTSPTSITVTAEED